MERPERLTNVMKTSRCDGYEYALHARMPPAQLFFQTNAFELGHPPRDRRASNRAAAISDETI